MLRTYAIVFLYILNNAIVITMYVYYVSTISLLHVPIRRYAKIVVRIILVSVVRLYYDHSIIIL